MPDSFILNVGDYVAELNAYLPLSSKEKFNLSVTQDGNAVNEIEFAEIKETMLSPNSDEITYYRCPPANSVFVLTIPESIYNSLPDENEFKTRADQTTRSITFSNESDLQFDERITEFLKRDFLLASLESHYKRLGLTNMLDLTQDASTCCEETEIDPRLITFRKALLTYEFNERKNKHSLARMADIGHQYWQHPATRIFALTTQLPENIKDYFRLDAMSMNHFTRPYDKMLRNFKLKNSCLLAVINAVDAVSSYEQCKSKENRSEAITALKTLDELSKTLPSTRGFKLLGAAMVALGVALMAVGCIAALVSASLLPSGIFTPLGVVGLPLSGVMAGAGLALTTGGIAMFANRNKFTTIPKAMSDTCKALKTEIHAR